VSGMIGMDTSEIEFLAVRLRNEAEAISGVVDALDRAVYDIGQNWRGPMASEWLGWWQGRHRPALCAAQASVAGLAQSADNNVKQQQQASSVQGGAGAASWAGSVSTAAGAVSATVAPAAVGVAAASTAAIGGTGMVSGSAGSGVAFRNEVVSTAEQQASVPQSAAYYGGPPGEWCASFVNWVLKKSGYSTPPASPANVSSWLSAAQENRNGLSIVPPGYPPQPGDLVVYQYSDGRGGVATPGHLGILTSDVDNSGGFSMVSGNFENTHGVSTVVNSDTPGTPYTQVSGGWSSYIDKYVHPPIFIRVDA